MDVNELYDIADSKHILIYDFHLPTNEAMSLLTGNDTYVVGIDSKKIDGTADKKHKLAHEIAHCETGSFYRRQCKFETIERCEARALRWEISHLVTEEDLHRSIEEGYTESWQIAEYLDVPEQLVKDAYHYYTEIK